MAFELRAPITSALEARRAPRGGEGFTASGPQTRERFRASLLDFAPGTVDGSGVDACSPPPGSWWRPPSACLIRPSCVASALAFSSSAPATLDQAPAGTSKISAKISSVESEARALPGSTARSHEPFSRAIVLRRLARGFLVFACLLP